MLWIKGSLIRTWQGVAIARSVCERTTTKSRSRTNHIRMSRVTLFGSVYPPGLFNARYWVRFATRTEDFKRLNRLWIPLKVLV